MNFLCLAQYKIKKSKKEKMPTKTAYITIKYKVSRFQNGIATNCSGEPNVRFGRSLRQEFGRTEQFGSVRQQTRCRTVRFGSVRPIFSDFYLIVRFGLPNSSAKSEPNSSVSSVRPNFRIGKVRFGSVRHKNSEFGSPLWQILKTYKRLLNAIAYIDGFKL